jgi:hypothetical protein
MAAYTVPFITRWRDKMSKPKFPTKEGFYWATSTSHVKIRWIVRLFRNTNPQTGRMKWYVQTFGERELDSPRKYKDWSEWLGNYSYKK